MSAIMFSVDAAALGEVLQALVGPAHLIRELQVTRGPLLDNPIDKLVEQYNEQATRHNDDALLQSREGV